MLDKAHKTLDKLSTLVHGLDAIEGIATQTLGKGAHEAFEALKIIAVIIDTLRSGFDGHLTEAAVKEEILSLSKTILDHDAAANQALHDKFDTKKR